MARFRVLLHSSRPNGWRWEVLEGSKLVKTGAAKTKNEANVAAKAEADALEAKANKTK